MRSSKWVILAHRDTQRCDITRNGRPFGSARDQDVALATIAAKFEEGDTVFLEEPDGYRTKMTARVTKRRRWREAAPKTR